MAKKLTVGLDIQVDENGVGSATLTPGDANNNPTTMPVGATVPAWTASDPSITVTPSADGTSASFVAGTTPLTGASLAASSTLADGVTVITGTSNLFDVIPAPPGAATQFIIAIP